MCNDIKDNLQVGLYFYVEGKFAFAGCSLVEAEHYGDFLIYPEGHYDTWDKFTDFNSNGDIPYDYYPRGRIVYRKTDELFIIYYDRCIEKHLDELFKEYEKANIKYELDEHYCCHKCNPDYVM